MTTAPPHPVRRSNTVRRAPQLGVWVAMSLIVAAAAVPAITQWHVHANAFAPLSANWRPRLGIGTPLAVAIAVVALRWAEPIARDLAWRRLLVCGFFGALAWLLALALVDGRAGIAAPLDSGGDNDYLSTARRVHDIPALLHDFIARIPHDSPGAWPTHVAGHPPGALLFFVVLVRVGLGSGLAAGLVVTAFAATVPVAVLVTVRALGAESAARRAAPFLVVGPAAVWSAVSGDALFAAVLAWGLCALAVAATARGPARCVGWALVSGVLLGLTLLLSYGLALAGLLAVGVLVAARSWRAAVPAAAATLGVVGAFAAAGFSWWQALPVLHDRYYAGLASVRPASYWVWGDLAALAIAAGPALGASIAITLGRVRAMRHGPHPTRVVVILTAAAATCVALADATLLSKAEVERIWLPFVPWLLLGAALLTARLRRRLFAAQLVAALVLQTLLFTKW